MIAAVIPLGSSLRFAIAAPDSSTAAVTGILAASLVERVEAAYLSAPLLPPVLITLGLSTGLTGIVLCELGLTRTGPRHPLRALSGGRRLPRRHRAPDRHGRDPGDHRSSRAVRNDAALHRRHHAVGARRRPAPWRMVLYLRLAPLAQPVRPADHPGRRHADGTSGVLDRRDFAGGSARPGLDLPAAAGGGLHAALAHRRSREFSLVRRAGPARQRCRRDLRHGLQHAVQHHWHRGRRASRGQSGARAQRHQRGQHPDRRARRLCRLHLGLLLDPQFLQAAAAGACPGSRSRRSRC